MWLDLFAKKVRARRLSQDDFLKYLGLEIQKILPDIYVVSVKGLDAVMFGLGDKPPSPFNISHLYKLVDGDPNADAQLFERTVKGIVDVVTGKAQKFDGNLERVLPMPRALSFIENNGFDLEKMPHRPLGDDAAVTYVADNLNAFIYITQVDLEDLRIDPVDLHEAAIDNLTKLERSFEWQHDGALGFLLAGGDYEASHFLNEPMWEEVQAKFVGAVFAFVPAKDLLVFADSARPGVVDLIAKRSREIYENSPYPVSRQIFIRRKGEMQVY